MSPKILEGGFPVAFDCCSLEDRTEAVVRASLRHGNVIIEGVCYGMHRNGSGLVIGDPFFYGTQVEIAMNCNGMVPSRIDLSAMQGVCVGNRVRVGYKDQRTGKMVREVAQRFTIDAGTLFNQERLRLVGDVRACIAERAEWMLATARPARGRFLNHFPVNFAAKAREQGACRKQCGGYVIPGFIDESASFGREYSLPLRGIERRL